MGRRCGRALPLVGCAQLAALVCGQNAVGFAEGAAAGEDAFWSAGGATGQLRLGRRNSSTLAAVGAPSSSAPFGVVRALQWNPHWQCFKNLDCKQQASQALTDELNAGLDFANVVGMHVFKEPSGWSGLQSRCGLDVTTLYYNTERWTPYGRGGAGCMERDPKDDRSYFVQPFESSAMGLKIVVVGAHFPHGGDWGSLRNRIGMFTAFGGTTNVLFMGDVNTNSRSSSVFSSLKVPKDYATLSTDSHRTCCNTAKGWGFVFYYDRVIANFGKAMHTNLLFHPLPDWAKEDENEFHKGIIGDLYLY